MQCPKCKRVWRTLPGEEQDHDCSCGFSLVVNLDLADVETRPAEMTDEQIDLRREMDRGIMPWWKSGAREDREYYGRNYR